MKTFFSIAIWVLPVLLLAQGQDKKNEFKTVDNISLNDKIYTVKVKHAKREFKLKICDKDSCFERNQELSLEILSENLTRALIDFVISDVDTTLHDSLIKPAERAHLDQLIDRINALIDTDKSEAQKTLESVDKATDIKSGILKLNKTVQFKIDDNGNQNEFLSRNSHKDDTLIIKEVSIQFFNNKATSIFIQAELTNGNIKESLNFLNNKFSIPMRAFNYDGYTLGSKAKNGEFIRIDMNHIFDYVNDEFFNYSIANSQHVLSTDTPENSSKLIEQRRFFDFFTAVIYSDVMGFNTENSNSLLNAQATLLVPMNQRNTKQWTATRQFLTIANIALNNSFENESRYMAFADEENVNHFDLLRKNNFYGRVALDVLTYESKGWFLNTSLGYSTTFYRTGFRYTETVTDGQDVTTDGQIFSLGHGPYINFEFRPQTNFGADITIGLEDLNYNDSRAVNNREFGHDIFEDKGHNYFIFQHNLINVSANFYWLTNPLKSAGGIYAKVGTIYHTPSNSIFPQILVGYATNLTSFVNRFKPKSGTTQNETK